MKLLFLAWMVSSVAAFGGANQVCLPKKKLERVLSTGGQFDLTASRGFILTSGQDSTKFTIQDGDLKPKDVLQPMWSASKLVTSLVINRVIEESTVLTLDTPISQVIDWWTTDPNDPRSEVTMRHLLSQTSGFGSDPTGQHGPATCELNYVTPCADDALGLLTAAGTSCEQLSAFGCDFDISSFSPAAPEGTTVSSICQKTCGGCDNLGNQESCSKDLYNTQFGKLQHGMVHTYPDLQPSDVSAGSHFAYGESHFVIAVYAAEQVSGKKWNALFRSYLADPLKLDGSCSFPDAPTIDGGAMLQCSSAEFSKILAAHYRGDIVKQETTIEMETAQSFLMGAKIPAGNGFYGLGNWVSCVNEDCSDNFVHSIGFDGVLPLIDRKGGYWGLVVREGGAAQGKTPGQPASQAAMPTIVDHLRKVYSNCPM